MKTRFLIVIQALFSFIFVGTALEDPPTNYPLGVGGIGWGSSLEQAKKAMLARPGVTLVSEDAGKLIFGGGSFAEQTAENWELLFTKGKFSEAAIRLKTVDALSQYEALRKLITTKYRKAGREEKEGSAHRATYWEYSQTTGKWGIVCDVRIPGSLTIRYKDKSPSTQPGKGAVKDIKEDPGLYGTRFGLSALFVLGGIRLVLRALEAMSEPDPLQLRRIKIARQINALLNHFVGVIDAKASAFLAGSVAAGSFLLREMPHPFWGRVLYFTALGCYAISVLMAGATIFPRVPRTGDSVLFWGDIAASGSVREYTGRFDAVLDAGQLDEQYLAQNFLTARLLRRKFRCLRACIALFFIALFTSFAVFLAAAK